MGRTTRRTTGWCVGGTTYGDRSAIGSIMCRTIGWCVGGITRGAMATCRTSNTCRTAYHRCLVTRCRGSIPHSQPYLLPADIPCHHSLPTDTALPRTTFATISCNRSRLASPATPITRVATLCYLLLADVSHYPSHPAALSSVSSATVASHLTRYAQPGRAGKSTISRYLRRTP